MLWTVERELRSLADCEKQDLVVYGINMRCRVVGSGSVAYRQNDAALADFGSPYTLYAAAAILEIN